MTCEPFHRRTRQGNQCIRSSEAAVEEVRRGKKVRCAHLSASARGIVGSFVGRKENLQEMAEKSLDMAEREGFEPPIRLPVCRISSAVHSTTLPPLHPIEMYANLTFRFDTIRLLCAKLH